LFEASMFEAIRARMRARDLGKWARPRGHCAHGRLALVG
jgi:hypothetical protein